MPSSGKTAHYGLNDWIGTDVPDMDDFNKDNEIIDAALHQGFGRVDQAITALNRVEYRGAVHTRQGLADTLEREQDVHDRRLEVLETAPKGDTEEQVEAHIRDRENPHRVTAEQLGGARLERLGAMGLEVVFEKLPDLEVMPTGRSSTIAFSPNGLYMVVGHSTAPYLTVYKNGDGMYSPLTQGVPTLTASTRTFIFTPDSRYFIISWYNSPSLVIYECNDNGFQRLPNSTVLPKSVPGLMCFSPNGRHLALANTLERFEFTDGILRKLPDPDVPLPVACSYLAYSPDGNYLAVCCRDTGTNAILLYKTMGDNLQLCCTFDIDPTNQSSILVFSPDGKYLVDGHSAYIFNNGSLNDIGIRLSTWGHRAAFSPDGRYLAVGRWLSGKPVTIYEFLDQEFVELPLGDRQPVLRIEALAFSPDGQYLAAGYMDANYFTLYKITPEARGIATLDEEGTIPLNQLSHKVVTVDNIAAVLRDLGFAIE